MPPPQQRTADSPTGRQRQHERFPTQACPFASSSRRNQSPISIGLCTPENEGSSVLPSQNADLSLGPQLQAPAALPNCAQVPPPKIDARLRPPRFGLPGPSLVFLRGLWWGTLCKGWFGSVFWVRDPVQSVRWSGARPRLTAHGPAHQWSAHGPGSRLTVRLSDGRLTVRLSDEPDCAQAKTRAQVSGPRAATPTCQPGSTLSRTGRRNSGRLVLRWWSSPSWPSSTKTPGFTGLPAALGRMHRRAVGAVRPVPCPSGTG